MNKLEFLGDDASFRLQNPEQISYLYFPLASEAGLKSAITPNLGGDSKLDQETFLLEPVSAENLHASRSTRNFWCITDQGCWSATGVSALQESQRFTPDADASTLTAGLMWQRVCRASDREGLRAEITSFVPPGENVELMAVRITNTGAREKAVTGVAAVPIYGRSADNIRDHRNVTSMLHRIRTTEYGVLVKPTMSFDEKGHRANRTTYYVLGSLGDGGRPRDFYPTVESFALGRYMRLGRGWRPVRRWMAARPWVQFAFLSLPCSPVRARNSRFCWVLPRMRQIFRASCAHIRPPSRWSRRWRTQRHTGRAG